MELYNPLSTGKIAPYESQNNGFFAYKTDFSNVDNDLKIILIMKKDAIWTFSELEQARKKGILKHKKVHALFAGMNKKDIIRSWFVRFSHM